MRVPRSISLVLGLATVGCHTLRPIALDEVRPGMEVRARISESQAAELADYLPAGRDRVVEGRVLEADPEGLFLMVPVTTRNVPGQMEVLGQRLSIPRGEIFEVELRDLDRAKTGVVTAATALLTGFVLYKTLEGGSSGGTPGPGGPGPQDAIIVLRIPVLGR